MLVSIIIPCFNVKQYLPCLIEQFLEFDTSKIELILIDDASTDGTVEYIESLQNNKTLSIQTLFHQTNYGQSIARNNGIKIARGEYVWFLDSDDLIVVEMMSKVLNILSKEKPDILFTGIYSFLHKDHYCTPQDVLPKDIISKEFYSFKPYLLIDDVESILYHYFQSVMMYPCCAILHRSCVDKIRFPVGKKLEDVATMPKYVSLANSCYYIPKPLVYYRRRPNSTMSTSKIETFIDFSRSMHGVIIFFQNKKLSKKTHLEMFLCYLTLLRWSLNDMVNLGLLSEQTWKEYEKSLEIFWSILPYNRFKLFSAIIQSYSLKRIVMSATFLISPKFYVRLIKVLRKKKYT